ncbi:MAG: aminotransferase class V-fold PLP-dependent enzyme [Candidatus Binatia bacterium]
MYITVEAIKSRADEKIRCLRRSTVGKPRVNFLPGPVAISDSVRQRFSEPPLSHRSESFLADFKTTQTLLCAIVNAMHVEILMGSGTLANDAIAAQFSVLSAPGLILSNGEFGERLIDHARRFRLSFEIHRTEWGNAFHETEIAAALARHPKTRWLWAVHCETSTGVLNDLAMLKQTCAANRMRLAVDCVSSIGAVQVDLSGVFLASAVSGKGLGAFPGLSMVFHETELVPAPSALPRYLDLGYYAQNDGIPFTLSSNLLYALRAALDQRSTHDFAKTVKLAAWLRAELRGMGMAIVGDERKLSPAITTIALPSQVSSRSLGHELEEAGYLLSYLSGYLLERNWLQICLMGEISERELRSMVEELRRRLAARSSPGVTPAARFARAS